MPVKTDQRKRLAKASCSALAILVLGSAPVPVLVQPAMAQCTPDDTTASDGDDVVCSGASNGFQNDGFDDGTITVLSDAVIDGSGSQGIEFDDDVTITIDGKVSSTGDHAVQGDNDAVIVVNGTLESSGGDGLNVDNDAMVTNNGTIISTDDDAIQVEDDSTVINNGTIIATVDEGINANAENATIINNGTITTGDDAINAAENATITNTGKITVTGDQDGIDLDDGTITNSGTIMSLGAEDGIDFDGGSNASTVTNSGTISGNLGINVDPADGQSQTVINTGTLTGTGGQAMNLGDNDDTLIVGTGSLINGTIDLGTGNNTFEVVSPVAGLYEFASAPETVVLNNNLAIQSGNSIALIDQSPFAALGALASGFNRDLNTALTRASSTSFDLAVAGSSHGDAVKAAFPSSYWASGFGSIANSDRDGLVQGYETRGGGIVFGTGAPAGHEGLGFFAGYATYSAELDDNLHEASIDTAFIGMRATSLYAENMAINAQLLAGWMGSDLESPTAASGDGSSHDAFVSVGIGFTAREGQFSLNGHLNYMAAFGRDMVLSGLGGAKISSDTAHYLNIGAEAGYDFTVAPQSTIRPFVAVSYDWASSGETDVTTLGNSVSFNSTDTLDGAVGSIGAELFSKTEAGANIALRGEFAFDEDGDTRTTGMLKYSLAF